MKTATGGCLVEVSLDLAWVSMKMYYLLLITLPMLEYLHFLGFMYLFIVYLTMLPQ
jgi:hypothetical protein